MMDINAQARIASFIEFLRPWRKEAIVELRHREFDTSSF
jgi:hypothetical protein